MKPAVLSIADLRAVVRQLPDNGLAPSREAALAHLDQHGLLALEVIEEGGATHPSQL